MIEIYSDRLGDKCRLLVKGHAEQADEGRLVCAAVSALTGALVQYAEGAPDCRCVRTGMETGCVFLTCAKGLGNAFDMTVLALARLAEEYPAHLRICREK